MGRPGSAKSGGRRSSPKAGEKSSWLDLGTVTDLIRLMDENRLVEVEIENGGSKIRLVRDHLGLRNHSGEAPVTPRADPAPPVPDMRPAARAVDARGRPIISPMVGTFYRSASPDAPPFVEVGSVVDKGDTLCIIEAMKMMNEIEAEFRGRVTRVVADNGQTVEYGEELFLVEPLA